jgi:hypothetical protein
LFVISPSVPILQSSEVFLVAGAFIEEFVDFGEKSFSEMFYLGFLSFMLICSDLAEGEGI